MKVAIVAHHSRRERAEALAATVDADRVFMDEGSRGPTPGHLEALEWANGERLLTLEDDALPVPGFRDKVDDWVARFPDDLCSLYLGTGHPRSWMRKVDEQWDNDSDVVTLPTLIHAVCYTIPPRINVVDHIDKQRPIDFALGDAWHAITGRDVIYPKRSLVDHDDHQPSIAQAHRGSRNRDPRRARLLAQ